MQKCAICDSRPLTAPAFSELLNEAIEQLDVDQAYRDVAPFVKDRRMLDIWSREFFRDVAGRIVLGSGAVS
ncbi:MAG TPA: hypothetical protein VJ161_06780 [Geobacteraceae bacterium]|nr:hypothetical protein [Geobacteraceae bacterium]